LQNLDLALPNKILNRKSLKIINKPVFNGLEIIKGRPEPLFGFGFAHRLDALGAGGDFFAAGRGGRLQIGELLPFGGRVVFGRSQTDARPGHHSLLAANCANFGHGFVG
jgi:hypothetical protein